MVSQEIQQQVIIEHQTMAHVVSALRTTIGWESKGPDFSRKLSSLQFVCESFERHLVRLLELEETDGYMSVVLDSCPEMSERVRVLHDEHSEFRREVRDILSRLNAVSSTDHKTFGAISDELVGLLDRLDQHQHNEITVLQEALLQDAGGEG